MICLQGVAKGCINIIYLSKEKYNLDVDYIYIYIYIYI